MDAVVCFCLQRWCLAVIVAGALLAAGAPGARAAQGGIQIVDAPAPVYDFGGNIAFQLAAQSPVKIAAVNLFVNTGGLSPAVWHSAPFQAERQVTATVSFDLAVNPLPPFSAVSYWWQVTDAAGQTLTTAPASFTYEDNRFTWQTAASGSVVVHWYRGEAAFGQSAASIATSALPSITQDVRAPLPEHVNIYIYATDTDVQSALGRVGVAYANGHADPKLGVVIISVAPDLRANDNLQIQIPHELTHVLIFRATGSNYTRVPTWFNEGLAVIHQGQRDSNFPALLAAARDSQQFISLSSLCGPFTPAEVSLAYAESESVVGFVRRRFGAEGVNRLLTAYAGGADCASGVQSSLGLSLDQLQAAWQADLAPAPVTTAQRLQALAPWLLLAALVLLAPFSMLLVAFRRPPVGPSRLPDRRQKDP